MKSIYFCMTLVLIFLFLTTSSPVCASIFDGLVSAWPFDSNLNDSVGNNDAEFFGTGTKPPEDKPKEETGPTNTKRGIVSSWDFDGDLDDDVEDNDGEFKGAPAKNNPVYVDGKFGRAVLFDGIDDYIEIPDDKSLQLPEGLTVAAWINYDVGKDHSAICWKGQMIGWGANFSWRIATTSDTGITWGRCKEGVEGYFATDGVLPGKGKWIHVALTCMSPDAPTTQRVYVDGKDVTDVTGQTDNIKIVPPFLIFDGFPVIMGVGRGYGGVAGDDVYFSGIIDDVGIWDRGLTEDEINEVMKRGLPSAYSVDASGKIVTTWGNLKK